MSETNDDKLSRVRLMADGDPTWDLSPNDLVALKCVMDELDRLQAIVDRLPKTADGVPIAAGDYVYDSGRHEASRVTAIRDTNNGFEIFTARPRIGKYYSTREAYVKAQAEAAIQKCELDAGEKARMA